MTDSKTVNNEDSQQLSRQRSSSSSFRRPKGSILRIKIDGDTSSVKKIHQSEVEEIEQEDVAGDETECLNPGEPLTEKSLEKHDDCSGGKISLLQRFLSRTSIRRAREKDSRKDKDYPELRYHTGGSGKTKNIDTKKRKRGWNLIADDDSSSEDYYNSAAIRAIFKEKDGKAIGVAGMALVERNIGLENGRTRYRREKRSKGRCGRCGRMDKLASSYNSTTSSQGLSRASSTFSAFSSGFTTKTNLSTSSQRDASSGEQSSTGRKLSSATTEFSARHRNSDRKREFDDRGAADEELLVDTDSIRKEVDGVKAEEERQADRMNSFPKPLPNIRRHDLKTSTIKQHYYPEGGWGWVICGCVFFIHILTTGMQFSYGVLYTDLVALVGKDRAVTASWIGSTSLAMSRGTAPLVVALCRRKSTRLTAVIGGLVMSLGILFASFALQLHQIFLSWSLVLGIGVGLTRETATLMTGQYFKRRREFVEIIVQSGSGVGITLFSVFFKETIRSIGWRLGLQAVTGVVFLAFILGIFYRSASLYHPQRRAILHLKNQKKRQVKDKSRCDDKPPYFEMHCLRIRSVQIIVLATAMFSAGIYAPIFFLILGAQGEGLEDSSLILLQTFLGFAYALGSIGFGLIIVRQSTQCFISRQNLCQGSLFALGATSFSLTAVRGYHGYALFMWLYGILLGGVHYALQMLTLEKARAKHFPRAWGFIQASSAIPILVGVPITGYINEAHSKSGYFFSSACIIAGASCLFLLKKATMPADPQTNNAFRVTTEGSTLPFGRCDSNIQREMPPFSVPIENGNGGASHLMTCQPKCTCGMEPSINPYDPSNMRRLAKNISFARSMDSENVNCRPELLTCVSEEGLLEPCCQSMAMMEEACGVNTNMCGRYNVIPHLLPKHHMPEDRFMPSFHTQSLPRRYHPNPTTAYPNRHIYSEVRSLPRGFSAQSCGRLRNSSAVSFSEPEGLARIGSIKHYPNSSSQSTASEAVHPLYRHRSSSPPPTNFQINQLPPNSMVGPPPVPPPRPRGSILRRLPISSNSDRTTERQASLSYSVMDDRTTSV